MILGFILAGLFFIIAFITTWIICKGGDIDDDDNNY